MFARYRRGGSAAATPPPPPQSSRSGGPRICGLDDAAAAAASLGELRGALDRLDSLVAKIAGRANEGENETDGADADNNEDIGGGGDCGAAPTGKKAATTPPEGGDGEASEGADAEKNKTEGNETSAAENADGAAVDGEGLESTGESDNNNVDAPSDNNDDNPPGKKKDNNNKNSNDNENDSNNDSFSPNTNYQRSESAAAADMRKIANAEFLAVEPLDEAEMIEIIRRIAELVVLSERRASQLLAEVAAGRAHGRAAVETDTGDGASDRLACKSGDENGCDGGGNEVSKGERGEGQSKGESTDEASSVSKPALKKNEGEREKDGEERKGDESMVEYNEDAALPHLALFELFCERNALANIVNVVTGAAFATGKASRTRPHLLPPLPVATQAVQSVSILIQNVSRATSLYFLLSNNRVNDLIRLPLHLYRRAERNALHARYNARYSARKRGKRREPLPPPPSDLSNYQSPEMAELTTHFVSFLKSLAMRVNAETLQFFLSFPLNENGLGNNAKSAPKETSPEETRSEVKAELMDTLTGEGETKAPAIKLFVDPSETKAELMESLIGEEGTKASEDKLFAEPPSPPKPASPPTSSASPCAPAEYTESNNMTYLERRNVVEFPLYARALEFCTTEQDSFVRVTAMNVCMNMIRLATVGSDEEDGEEEDGNCSSRGDGSEEDANDEPSCDGQQTPLPITATPSGMLHKAPPLPLQDRIAIARFACHPRRVSDLVSPLCVRLTGQFGQVEETVRALEELGGEWNVDVPAARAKTASPPKSLPRKSSSSSPLEKKRLKDAADRIKERDRLRGAVQNLIANVQDELLLLDDLLRVGLMSLNEQAIEMMMATFVYPMLLQPLLLPLHRFSSSRLKEENTGEGGPQRKRGRRQRPVIVLQSPPPFSSKPAEKEDESSFAPSGSTGMATASTTTGGESTDNTESEPKSALTAAGESGIVVDSDRRQLHSSSDMDLAPASTALFGLSVVFNTLSNPTFRHLLLTALLHPLAPEASGGVVISAPPQITLPIRPRKKRTAWSDDFRLEIRMEGDRRRRDEEAGGLRRDVEVYAFGTEPVDGPVDGGDNGNNNNGDFSNICVFILAPALVDMLRYNTTSYIEAADNGNSRTTDLSSTATTHRKNPYRNILLSSVSGENEMVALQPLATAALYAAVSSVSSSVVRKIMLPTTYSSGAAHTEVKNDGMVVSETLQCLCGGIVNAQVTYGGWWKAKFNTVAARTLMDVVSDNALYLGLVRNMLADVRLQAAEFLMTLPSLLDKKSKEHDKVNSTTGESPGRNNNPEGGQHLETWLLDRFFFDPADRHAICVVENVCYLKEQSKVNEKKKEQYRYGLEVLSSIDIGGTSSLLCEGTTVIDNNMVVGAAAARGNTPFHCAASWALTCLYLDAFCMKLSNLGALSDERAAEEAPSKSVPAMAAPLRTFERKLSYISATPGNDDESDADDEAADSLAHISSKFAIAMLDEGESSSSGSPGRGGGPAPAHGSAVGLVGKAAFPCVCEVSPQFAPLFSGRTCISNEGIQWQSLYLVVVGKWAVLAEPGHGGSGGEGRVITACRLACLAVRKDSSSLVNNKTPARRLLVAHASLDPRPPSLFAVDSSASSSHGRNGGGPNLGPAGLRLTRSRMDLWFEDSNAAQHACRVLSGKIAKARARRGERIRAALLAR